MHASVQVRAWPAREELCREGPGCPAGQQVDHVPAVCFCGQEGQWYPGLLLKKCGQQVEGGCPSPLVCPGEATSGKLCPVLGSSVKEWQRTAGGNPGQLQRWLRAQSISCMRKGWETWVCWTWRRLRGDLINAYKYLKDRNQVDGARLFSPKWAVGTNWNKGSFIWTWGKISLLRK